MPEAAVTTPHPTPPPQSPTTSEINTISQNLPQVFGTACYLMLITCYFDT
jgi:hypothetical protein